MEYKVKIKKKYFSIGILFWLLILAMISYWLYQSSEKDEKDPLIYQQSQPAIIEPAKIIISNQKNQGEETKEVRKLVNQESSQKTNQKDNQQSNISSSARPKSLDHYWIQISAYSIEKRNIAEEKVKELKKVGVRGSIVKSPSGFRLVVGPYDDLNLANIEKNKIREKIDIMDIFVYREKN